MMYNIEYKRFGEVTLADVYESRAAAVSRDTELSDNVIAYLRENPQSHLLMNFADVDYISSARLTDLLKINDVIRREGGSLRLTGLNTEIKKVFAMTKLDSVFRIEEDHLKQCIKQYHKEVQEAKKHKGAS